MQKKGSFLAPLIRHGPKGSPLKDFLVSHDAHIYKKVGFSVEGNPTSWVFAFVAD